MFRMLKKNPENGEHRRSFPRQQCLQGALIAKWVPWLAIVVSDGYELGVEVLPVIESRCATFLAQRIGAERLQCVIFRIGAAPIVAFEDAFGVGIDDKTVMTTRVKQHTVSGFGADAVDGE